MTAIASRALTLGPLVLALSLGIQVAQLAVPLLTMHVYDGVLSSHSIDTLVALAIAYALTVMLGGLLRGLRSGLLSAVADRVARRMQFQGLAAAVRRAVAGDRSAGLLALQDTSEVRRLLGGNTLADVSDLVALPAALTVLYMLHPWYFLLGIAGCLIHAVLGALADRTTRGLVRDATKLQAGTAADLTGRLRQRELLDCLGMLPAVLRRWRPQHVSMLAVQDAAHRRARSLHGLSNFLTQTLQMGMMALGGYLVTRHLASPGSILAASLLTGMASRPGSHLVAAWREWSFGTAAFTRLRATIASAEPARPAPSEEDAPAGLVMRGLTVEVPGKVLVRHLDLGVQPGELLLVAGPNGSGKSTLLRAMLGLLAPAEGVAMLDGQDTHRADRAVIGPRIGYLPQGAQLLEGTVMENITRFGNGSAAEAVAAARQAGAHETIGRLPEGYGHGAGGNAGLSGGQRQMVALARALYGNPRLLVLDEPEAGLDQTGLVGLRAAVAAAKARGAVVVLVTHQPGDWTELVDLRLRLSPGKGKAEGSWNLEIEEGAA